MPLSLSLLEATWDQPRVEAFDLETSAGWVLRATSVFGGHPRKVAVIITTIQSNNKGHSTTRVHMFLAAIIRYNKPENLAQLH